MYEKLAKDIITAVGGEENIQNVIHCMTRLRFTLVDASIVKDSDIKNMKGVISTAKNSQQYQVIIGNNVSVVYNEIIKQIGKNNVSSELYTKKTKITFKEILSSGLNTLSEILTPLVPALAASGMLKVILLILIQTGVLTNQSSTYIVLMAISDTTFYFLPIIVSYLSAEYFKVNKVLAMVFAGALIHPSFIELVKAGTPITLIKLPVLPIDYANSMIPTILMVWLMVYVEKIAEKFSPEIIKVFFKPLIMMIILPSITLLILGPIGDYIGKGIGFISTYSFENFGWITVAILSALLPFAVLTGLNKALTPISIQIYTTLGYEPLFRVAYIGANMAQGAAALAVAFKTKNKELKQIAFAAASTTLLSGITEPSLFGVNIKLKRPLIAAAIGGGLAGSYAGMMGVKGYAMAVPSLLSIPMFIGPTTSNLIHAIVAFVIVIISTFLLVFVIGFEDIEEPVVDSSEAVNQATIYSPLSGEVHPLSDVPDSVFSTGMLGKGFAIIPSEGLIVSPFVGRVTALFPTKHAIGLISDSGLELLIHIGIDTVELNGEGFEILVDIDNKIEKGTPLIKFDLEYIKSKGYSTMTPIILTNLEKNKRVNTILKGTVNDLDAVLEII
ncbi:beta-glucoside-specific PTS transporter subunit IIABC [Enterococcus faecalis]|uniref:beta-glucoside-specific PTS transporter subunit IIABC n=1 Tax=Enterococcus faecalis TaxID=1351 RepID=UPI0020901132|nr:beta-glucoside-specific PTS transporter subunit IIABC [Enterococcus faecalis]